jgi:hypothetical protein
MAATTSNHLEASGAVDPLKTPQDQFPSLWPDAPPDYEGVARTLSRDPTEALKRMEYPADE